MADEIIVLITAGDPGEAAKIAEALVGEHIAACVNIIPEVRSVFFWNGKTEHAQEVLLICKSRQELLDRLIARVKTLHSYSVPEIIALPIVSGSRQYLDWVRQSTHG